VTNKVRPQFLEDCKNGSSNPIKDLQNFNFELNQEILAQIEEDMEKQCDPRAEMKPMLPSTVDLSADPKKRSATDFIKLGLNNGLPIAIGFDSNLLIGDSYKRLQIMLGLLQKPDLTLQPINANIVYAIVTDRIAAFTVKKSKTYATEAISG